MATIFFNPKKQYACTEIHHLEAMQDLILELEDCSDIPTELELEAAETIREFLDGLVEQDKRT